jgi:hypothetical protein
MVGEPQFFINSIKTKTSSLQYLIILSLLPRKYHTCVTKVGCLIIFKDVTIVYTECLMEPLNIVLEQSTKLLNVNTINRDWCPVCH